MPVVFDSGFLGLLLHPDARTPDTPATGKPVDKAKERVDLLAKELEDEGIRILIPTPVLAEFLVLAKDSGPTYLALIDRSSRFEVVSYDQRAAVETAAATLTAVRRGDKRSGLADTPWQKLKIDRQVVAIAKSRGVHVIYSNDNDVAVIGRESGLEVRHVADLPVPEDPSPLFEGL